jgi:hypothetical protein
MLASPCHRAVCLLSGIESLKAKHPVVVAKDHKEVYQIINIEGIRNWGPSFALAQVSSHDSPGRVQEYASYCTSPSGACRLTRV